ncbi:AAA family ATPase [Streptomyces sp. SID8379]|uniref:uridine kinase family protein n=1 Tax=unclassified Streptomyces TaxID=2593676 RepID=UPI0003A20013|nr:MULTISPECIES: AAA family ATPase [unclassified Streptomyces]MYW63405.1 AAA family ATPase [Streptomyces sp. SID8379]
MTFMTMIPTGADKVAAALDARTRDGFVLVALEGMGGSGKSTLAEALAGLCAATVVHGDDFYRPMDPGERAALTPEEGVDRYFDWQRLRDEVLAPLTAGRDAVYRRYDWGSGGLAPDETHPVARTGVVVVEGVYTARPELAGFYDLVVYVDTPPEESMRRLRERGHDHGPLDWEARWRVAEEHYVATTRPRERADLVVPGH